MKSREERLHRARKQIRLDGQLVEQLKTIREQQGVSQEDLAFRMGITQPAVSSIESGNTDPKLGTLRRYANALGCVISHHVEPDDGSQNSYVEEKVVNRYGNQGTGNLISFSSALLCVINGSGRREGSGYKVTIRP
ncbi:helix-turn-helix transcriptional regulator [Bifidobacterium sp. W8113]|uniref:helix-turn-helix domain-containing protein n=1 Tax=Bifidobacterium choladohabitans TaxID=2750947 RepID=UPI0018DCD1DE|nr:helix-turn-helix transcriptional regulator [Bifidobacterium choladohabitans]MBI0089137.1 helix-turn-helix transcriptional regulator [Bifidobacterium choladohabitans]